MRNRWQAARLRTCCLAVFVAVLGAVVGRVNGDRPGLGVSRSGTAALEGDEPVAHVADGADQRFVLRAELGAKPPDMDVDSSGTAEVVVAPDLLEQLGSAEHPAWMLRQKLQQLELLERQIQRPAVNASRVRGFVDDQPARADFVR